MTTTPDLRAGRRALESIEGYQLMEDLSWVQAESCWHMVIRLTIPELTGGQLPVQTDWHILVSESYPWGRLKLYPDKTAGISQTFQHQNNNSQKTVHPWRSGDLCLATSFGAFSLRGFDSEPKTADARLAWNVKRCREWMIAASKGELALPGQHFELPHFPLHFAANYIFSEDQTSFSDWKKSPFTSGYAELIHHRQGKSIFVKAFKNNRNETIHSNNWNEELDYPNVKMSRALWLRLDFLPVLEPWEAPLDWKQLKEICHKNGVDINGLLSGLYIKHSAHFPTVVLLGFPIKEVIGGPECQLHWQPIALESFDIKNGFRSEQAKAAVKVQKIFHNDQRLKWMESQNGNLAAVSSRGKLPQELRNAKVLMIGAGALGSIIAECLVRGGCEHLSLIDPDIVELGNMSRHTLTTTSLDQNKAEQLAKRLSLIFPGVEVKWNKKSITSELRYNPNFLSGYDLVLDVTGSDEVLHFLSEGLKLIATKFASLSLGMSARRLYFYHRQENEEIETSFKINFAPWLQQEFDSSEQADFPREGLGCWHPLFPARVDDVFMMGAAAVKLIEKVLDNSLQENFYTIEQVFDATHGFQGLTVKNNSAA